ncbi:hypothetical protein BKA80DRAFT_286202 [Phyllosticta citrichinensis]
MPTMTACSWSSWTPSRLVAVWPPLSAVLGMIALHGVEDLRGGCGIAIEAPVERVDFAGLEIGGMMRIRIVRAEVEAPASFAVEEGACLRYGRASCSAEVNAGSVLRQLLSHTTP